MKYTKPSVKSKKRIEVPPEKQYVFEDSHEAIVQELTPGLLREFVERIIVHNAVKINGQREQEVEIHYNFVGTVGEMEAL